MSFNKQAWIQELNRLSVGEIHRIPFSSIPGITNDNGQLSKAYQGKKYAFKHPTLKNCYNSCGFEFVDVDFDNNILILNRVSESLVQNNIEVRQDIQHRNNRVRVDYIKHNEDLDLTLLERNPNNPALVIINVKNANIIAHEINNSARYGYVRAIPDLYATTNPDNDKLTVEKVIQRLIIIDQIDSVNIGMNTKAYEFIAESIINYNLEGYIRNNSTIPNNVFRKIANRQGLDPNKSWKIFSAISKYIARTAHYIYHNDSGYPIYDSVLRDNLHYYIPSLTKDRMEEIINNLDYESYCSKINEYLRNVNTGKDQKHIVTNLMFDQIVWYTHKTKSAPQRYR